MVDMSRSGVTVWMRPRVARLVVLVACSLVVAGIAFVVGQASTGSRSTGGPKSELVPVAAFYPRNIYDTYQAVDQTSSPSKALREVLTALAVCKSLPSPGCVADEELWTPLASAGGWRAIRLRASSCSGRSASGGVRLSTGENGWSTGCRRWTDSWWSTARSLVPTVPARQLVMVTAGPGGELPWPTPTQLATLGDYWGVR